MPFEERRGGYADRKVTGRSSKAGHLQLMQVSRIGDRPARHEMALITSELCPSLWAIHRSAPKISSSSGRIGLIFRETVV